ncbi:WD repeat-containing and planar cell polarity effector protein fritz [Anopheles darlingi]|uniref:WD repeat-containing and planar cell polarity effector protein fritz n=1 Tax=Anopheles darlingi TaxID=43151 RepID=UPI0021002363|nr:WD repeat-containing and planar cell polarity effector protein fritz [Anopheles darlingi]
MLTLLTELRFWSTREDIFIKDTDLGTTKYCEKKLESHRTLYGEGKRRYCETRGLKWSLDNKKPNKLRHSLRLLEDELRQRRLVYCKWKSNTILQLMLANGLLVYISINPFTGDLCRIYFDKYLVGKLVSEHITDVVITQHHLLIAYHEHQITFVHLQKPTARKNHPEKISLMEPKICNVLLSGASSTSRKLPKRLVCSSSLNLVIVWTKSSQNEVYPWRPTVKDQDRANLHVYRLAGARMELLCYYWTEYDPISVQFSLLNDYQVHCVEQKISKKGEVTIDSCIYQINKTKMRRVAVTSIPLQTQVCCNALSPDHEKLMLGCIDGSIVLFDEGRGITHLVKAAFIPTFVAWHSDSSVVMIANDKCQLQCFDIALSCVRMQLLSDEDAIPSGTFDLSNHFSHPHAPTLNLARLCWSRKPELAEHTEAYATTDSFLFCAFEQGPLACIRVVGGAGLKGDVHTSGLTADVLVHKYISLNQVEKAINILLSLNWDTYGAMCLLSLHRIANYIFKQPLGTERELQLQKALGSFLVPVKALCYETEHEFGDQVNDITLKFFHHLLRNKSYNKAFSLAIDINDADLFLKLHDKAKVDGDAELAREALRKADDINRICRTDRSSDSEHSLCSNSSCSMCADSFDDDEEDEEEEGEEEEQEEQNESSDRRRDHRGDEEVGCEEEAEDDESETSQDEMLVSNGKTKARRPAASAINGDYADKQEKSKARSTNYSTTNGIDRSFRSFSTSSGSSKSSQTPTRGSDSDGWRKNGTGTAIAHPPLPKTGDANRSQHISKTQTDYYATQDRPPLPFLGGQKPMASVSSAGTSATPLSPPFAMQRSQTATALKLSKQQQARIAESKLRGKSLSSSNLLHMGDEASSGMASPANSINRPRQLVNPREKAARFRLYSSNANSLSMDQLDISNRNRAPPPAAMVGATPMYNEYGEPIGGNVRPPVGPLGGYHHMHHPESSLRLTQGPKPQPLQLQQQQQHVVIDVVPKPSASGSFPGGGSPALHPAYSSQTLGAGLLVPHSSAPNSILDQTIGIPLVQDEPDYVRRQGRKPAPSPWFNAVSGAPTSNSNSNNAPRTIIHQYPLISGNIPSKFQLQQQQHLHQQPFELQLGAPGGGKYGTRKKLDAPTASILSNGGTSHSQSNVNSNGASGGGVGNNGTTGAGNLGMSLSGSAGGSSGASSSSSAITKRDGGEKNKVKFSDTVTVAVVPEIPRKEKLIVEKLRKQPMMLPPGPVGYGPFSIADPKRELAESLPLCHPNEDYLKDFTPMQELISNGNGEMEKKEEEKKVPNIKVVHFGVV